MKTEDSPICMAAKLVKNYLTEQNPNDEYIIKEGCTTALIYKNKKGLLKLLPPSKIATIGFIARIRETLEDSSISFNYKSYNKSKITDEKLEEIICQPIAERVLARFMK
ncbi:MAG: hypothetical protein M1416_02735 [Candidatus Pacearchaeota archaeon]|nr:hypothetical protein [Candidatus Pacearchaeota archaeon]